MKKYAFLTSVLALAACGGGSGGGHHGTLPLDTVADLTVPAELAGRVTATDNDAVTKMKSEVIVASNTNIALSRSGHSYTDPITGTEFKSYRLEDIKLYAAESVNTGNGYLQMGMDDTGRIDSMTMVLHDVGAPVERRGSDSYFYGPIFEYVADGDDEALFRMPDTGQTAAQLAAKKAELVADGKPADGHWVLINEHMDVVTMGRDIGNGKSLQYADFGHFNPVYKTKYKNAETLNDTQLANARAGQSLGRGDDLDKLKSETEFDEEMAEQDYQLFAGGYAISGTTLKDTLDTPKNTTFKGKAIGRVYTSIEGGNYDIRKTHFATNGITQTGDMNDGKDIAKLYTTNDATLTIDANGKQTLVMPFNTKAVGDKYYDVKLVMNADKTMENPEFTGNESAIGAQYRLYNALDNVVENQGSFKPKYYGVNTATEAAGTARLYSKENFGDGAKREYEVQAAWGMKKQ